MKTITLLLNFWNFNLVAAIFLAIIIIFHFTTNGNRLTNKSPLFFLAVVLYIIALFSPIDFLGKYFLFSAHMVQHILLLLIIPPMVLVSTNKDYLKRLTANVIFNKTGNILFYPVVAWFMGVGSMWILHIPNLLKAANDSAFWMNIQMIILPILGLIFVWPAFSPVSWQKLDPLPASIYLFLACVGCTILGILITFAPQGLYQPGMFMGNTEVTDLIRSNWGITLKTDQMIGGLIMWVPACVIYLSFIVIILYRWFSFRGYNEKEDESMKIKNINYHE